MLKKLLDARIITLVDQMVFSGTNFLMTLILTQICTPYEFGKYSFVFMLMLFGLTPFRNFTVMAMMANPLQYQPRRYLGSTLILAGGISVAFSIILAVFLFLFSAKYEIQDASWSIFVFCLSRYMVDLPRGYFFTYKKPQLSLLVDSCTTICIATMLYQNHIGGLSYIGALNILSTSYLVSFFLGMLIARPNMNINIDAIYTNLKFGRWLCFTGIFMWFNGNFLLMIASNYLGTFVVGALRAINNLFGPIAILLQVIENYVPVRAATILCQEGHRAMGAYLLKQSKWISIIILPVFFVVSFLSGIIISALFGDSYIPYKSLIPFIILAQVLGFYIRYFTIALRSLNYTQPIFYGYAITATFSILFSGLLIETFGFIGVGIGLVLFQIILLGFFYLIVKNRFLLLDQEAQPHTSPSLSLAKK